MKKGSVSRVRFEVWVNLSETKASAVVQVPSEAYPINPLVEPCMYFLGLFQSAESYHVCTGFPSSVHADLFTSSLRTSHYQSPDRRGDAVII